MEEKFSFFYFSVFPVYLRSATLIPPVVVLIEDFGTAVFQNSTIFKTFLDDLADFRLFWIIIHSSCVRIGRFTSKIGLGWLRPQPSPLSGSTTQTSFCGLSQPIPHLRWLFLKLKMKFGAEMFAATVRSAWLSWNLQGAMHTKFFVFYKLKGSHS